jgi:hypothetical protein
VQLRRTAGFHGQRIDRKVDDGGCGSIVPATAAGGEAGEQRQQRGMSWDGWIHENCLCNYLQV